MIAGIFTGNYGTVKGSGKASGPAIVAFNLAKALNKSGDLEFKMHVNSEIDPRCEQPNVERLQRQHFDKGYLDQFDVIHVVSSKDIALGLYDLGYKPIIGTNVVFDVPNPEGVKLKDRKRLQSIINQEVEIGERGWGLALVPNVNLVGLHAKRLGLPLEKVLVFPCGIDTDYFSPSDVKRDSIVWVGPGEKKGEEIVTKLAAYYPDEKWIFKGKDGPYDYFDHVKDLQRAKVYISASKAETQGIATMEALAAGAPLILARHKYDSSDGKGYVEKDPPYCTEAGFVVGRNINDFKVALDLLLSDQSLREEMSKTGRKYILDNFGLGQMAENYKKLLLYFTRDLRQN